MTVESISAITLAVKNMGLSLSFYQMLGFKLKYGGNDSSFTSLAAGSGFLNLTTQENVEVVNFWGRVIFHVSDVDATYRRMRDAGYDTLTTPADARWGERYFHISDPDGHELSIARPL